MWFFKNDSFWCLPTINQELVFGKSIDKKNPKYSLHHIGKVFRSMFSLIYKENWDCRACQKIPALKPNIKNQKRKYCSLVCFSHSFTVRFSKFQKMKRWKSYARIVLLVFHHGIYLKKRAFKPSPNQF